MPYKGSRGAPEFDPDAPLALERYWMDLERLFRDCGITDTQQKKDYAQSYLKNEEAIFWAALPEHRNITVSWDDYKTAVNRCHPGKTGDNFCTRSSLEDLTKEEAPKVKTVEQLGAFYRKYRSNSD